MQNTLTGIKIKRLLVSNLLFKSAMLVTQVFLNIYLFKNSNDIQVVALFNIVLLTSQTLSFTFFARIVKFGYRNVGHIASLLGLMVIYFILILLGENVLNYYIYLAFGIGLCSGLYRIIYNNNEYDLTSNENRGNYQGLKTSSKILSAMTIPPLVGVIIAINYNGHGYQIAYGLAVILLLLTAFIGYIKIHYNAKTNYSLVNALKLTSSNLDILKLIANLALLGFALSNPLIETVIPVLLYNFGAGEMKIGFIISIFSFFTAIVSIFIGKYVNYNKYKKMYIWSCYCYVLFVIILLFFPNYLFVVLFASVLNLLFALFGISQGVMTSNIFSELEGSENFKSEYMVLREIPLMSGRIISFICIYFIGSLDTLGIRVLFGLMALILLGSSFLIKSVSFHEKR